MARGNNQNADGGIESGNSNALEQGGENSASAKADTGNASGTGTGNDSAGNAGTGNGTGNASGKSEAGNNATVNPADISANIYARDENGNIVLKANGEPAKKRGRPVGGGGDGLPKSSAAKSSAPKSKPAKGDDQRAAIATEMLAAQFQILNTGIAFLTKFDDFRLDDDEATKMASATANVLAQFDYVPDPKIAAVMGLVTTTSMIYGPRVYLYRQFRKEKIEQQKQARRNDPETIDAANIDFYRTGNFSG